MLFSWNLLLPAPPWPHPSSWWLSVIHCLWDCHVTRKNKKQKMEKTTTKNTPFIEDTIFSPLCAWYFCWRSFGHIRAGVLLSSLFCSIGWCVYLYASTILFRPLFCSQKVSGLWLCSSFSRSFGYSESLWFHMNFGIFFFPVKLEHW